MSLCVGLIAGLLLATRADWRWWAVLLAGLGIFVLLLSLFLGGQHRGWRHPLLLRLSLLVVVSALSASYVHLRSPLPAHSLQPQWAGALRQASRHTLEQTKISPEVKTLVEAIALGNIPRGERGRELRAIFVDGGIAHLLAVSGFHLGVIYLILAGLLRLLRLRDGYLWVGELLLLLGCGGYTLVTGATIPTLRSLLMLGMYLMGHWVGRRTYALNILASSAVCQYLYDPYSLGSYSFVLSYVAMLGIFLFFPLMEDWLGEARYRLTNWIGVSILLTIAVQALLLPLGLYLFGRMSWAYVWTTLPSMAVATLLIPLSFLLFLLGGCGLSCFPLEQAIEWLGRTMLELTDSLGSIEILTRYLRLELWQLLLWYLPILLCALWMHKRQLAEDSVWREG